MKNNDKKPTSIVVFGATGDLAKRKLFPAFFNLFLEGWFPEEFEVLSLGRTEQTQEEFRNYILENIRTFSRIQKFSQEQWNNFSEKIKFIRFDITQEESFIRLKNELDTIDVNLGIRSNRLFYLSVAPSFIETVSNSLKNAGLTENVDQDRMIIEKPFGYDKASAVALNKLLSQTFKEV